MALAFSPQRTSMLERSFALAGLMESAHRVEDLSIIPQNVTSGQNWLEMTYWLSLRVKSDQAMNCWLTIERQ